LIVDSLMTGDCRLVIEGLDVRAAAADYQSSITT
jgi:hypothetical protein